MSATIPTTLAERVNSVIRSETGNRGGPHAQLAVLPGYRGTLSQFELDLCDWGYIFGLALALARLQEPCETLESVTDRAHEAATEVYRRYGGEVGPRPRGDELLERTARACHEHDGALYGLPTTLHEALIDVYNQVGVPA